VVNKRKHDEDVEDEGPSDDRDPGHPRVKLPKGKVDKIGHFQVHLSLHFKARLSVKSLS